jgi:glycosyltransferase involved in cell wall biosynthesis
VTAVAILLPVLGRPHRIMPVADSALEATPNGRVVFLATADDEAVIREIRNVCLGFGDQVTFDVLPPNRRGDYARKINRGIAVTDEEFVFFGADDLAFHPGWFDRAVALMSDEIAVVGTQDLANRRVLRGDHSTHPLVARWYVDQAGTIDEPRSGKALHEGYWHEYVDDEFIATAKARQVWAFCHDAVVEHLHPSVGKAPVDDLYAAEPQRMVQGRILFERRKWMWTSRS